MRKSGWYWLYYIETGKWYYIAQYDAEKGWWSDTNEKYVNDEEFLGDHHLAHDEPIKAPDDGEGTL